MRKTEEREINGTTYSVAQFVPTEALEYQMILMKLIGKPLAALYSSTDLAAVKDAIDNEDDDDIDSFKEIKIDLEAGVAQLADAVNPKEHTKFIKNMLRHVQANGVPVVKQFDNVFMGKIMEIYQVLMFVIEVNYPDFFSKISGIVDRLPKKEQNGSPENTEAQEAA